MQASAKGFIPSENLVSQLVALLPEFEAQGLTWQVQLLSPLLDSANIQPKHWGEIADKIANAQGVDAVLVIHGTDSMAYTASALSFLLHQRIEFPVVLTGSQYPIGIQDSDAVSNFVEAVDQCMSLVEGVHVSFAGQCISGARSAKIDANALTAFGAPKQATMAVKSTAIGFDFTQDKRDWNDLNVGVIRVSPSLQSKQITAIAETKPDAIILEVYGVGTLPDQDETLLKAFENAVNQGTIIIAVTQCADGELDFDVYATGQILQQLKVINGYDLTTEAALTKVMVLLHLGYSEAMIRTLMSRNICGEMTDV